MRMRTLWGIVGINLLLFILLTSSAVFQARHHHWIFPAMAGLVALQWGVSWVPAAGRFPVDLPLGRSVLLSLLSFLVLMGVVRHETILTCFDTCSLKLSYALWMTAAVFFLQRRAPAVPFWNPVLCEWAALTAGLWAGYLILYGRGLSPWTLEWLFVPAALVLWLGRDRPAVRVAALGVPAALALRHVGAEGGRIAAALALAGVSAGVLSWGAARGAPAGPAGPPPLWRRGAASVLRIGAAVAGIVLVVALAMGPTRVSLDPRMRRAHLLGVAVRPASEALSPLARDLRRHVEFLAGRIGPRPVYDREAQTRVRAYLREEFQRAGYTPEVQEYDNQWLPPLPRGRNFANIEAVLPGRRGTTGGIYVVGAHYDTAAGTPGADDNTSGVAVLLEAARRLRGAEVSQDIRFVAFGTEEPPSFGTVNMGSHHYARLLKTQGVPLRLMVSLEMLGYYNSRPGSQLYPPFLQLFFPDRGDYVSLVSNGASRGELKRWGRAWRSRSSFPLETVTLPSVLSQWALSDQLNFWDAGFTALMLSDTAFFRNPHYHEPSDTPETLDYNKMAQVTEALVHTLLSLDHPTESRSGSPPAAR